MGAFSVINPATGKTLASYPEATDQEIEAVVASAQAAYSSWARKTTVVERAAIAGKLA
ncbi:aldehyde dehydrogenase family protein, partial [Bacillus sp. SIMBA_008]|uniref:aldehyde dehydrogenase family protein n=1 Tax=Bacillus sp. SIMBA_008 TaxID=3085757 RepID=UPI00397E30AE